MLKIIRYMYMYLENADYLKVVIQWHECPDREKTARLREQVGQHLIEAVGVHLCRYTLRTHAVEI